MKRYKVEYLNGDRSKPFYLTQISKSGKWNGVRIVFKNNGTKIRQTNWKNYTLSGMGKYFSDFEHARNLYFINHKKINKQGIQIIFYK